MATTLSVIERQSASLGDAVSDDTLFARLLDAAAELRPLVAKRARQTEQDRRVSSDVTNLLREAGLYRVVQPRRFGGYELSLEALRRLAFELGQGCASTGWCYGLSAAASWVVGMFPEQAQHDVWGESPDALIASCIAPTGKATPTEGGFRLKGRWSFAQQLRQLYVAVARRDGRAPAKGQPPAPDLPAGAASATTRSSTTGTRSAWPAPAARTSGSMRKCSFPRTAPSAFARCLNRKRRARRSIARRSTAFPS